MEVAVSVGGKFHMFNLAQQLEKNGCLKQFITSYPKFEVVKYGIPRAKTNSIIIKELIERGWRKLPRVIKNLYNPQYFIHEVYDRLASMRIKKADIVVGNSSMFSHTMKKAKGFGAITVVERGSSHILYQKKILQEEYQKFGVKEEAFQLPHIKVIEKELKEYEGADYISVPSLFVKRTFLENGIPESKLIHVPYGVDLSWFKQIPQNDDVFRVIFSGGLSLRKGTHYLLRAFSELNLPNSELLLIGSISDEIIPFLKKYEGKYRHVEYFPIKKLHEVFSQGSVFCMPSIEEGLAMVQPMAMACGLPLICTTNTGGGDIIRDGVEGFVISIRDVEKIKEKILFLYQNPEVRSKMGELAKQRVSSSFTWDNYGDKMIEMYKKILKDKNV
jgi:glycosyltransferase involved in cell wall biosynthesis